MKSGSKNTTTPHPVGPSGFVRSFTAGWGGIDGSAQKLVLLLEKQLRRFLSVTGREERGGGEGRLMW